MTDGTCRWMVSLGGTSDPVTSLSAALTTCHMRHGPDPPSHLARAPLPSGPTEQQAALPSQLWQPALLDRQSLGNSMVKC